MIPTTTVVAIRCPECGKMEYISVSLFSFSGSNGVALKCSCGYEIIKLTTKKRQDFWFQYICAMCEGRHLLKVTRGKLWSGETPLDLVCEETGIEVGYVGSREKVREKVKKQDQSLAEMADKLGFTEFFNNSSVMYEVLEHVYDIAERGKLYCTCGNYEIEVEIYPEYIQLTCEKCKASGKVMADKEEDLHLLKKTWELKLTRNGFLFNKTEDYNNHNF
ncbi:hypothetical protein [Desulfitibacter alkalitolerans]|uniref:hypothetical protein n=1 Tax=Desulfitibacter alkalitolerans TaxID=264641 RepID=UPI000684D967|nr:hypothetical protein [Desulfitibacter alkalitolerans]